MASLPNDKSRAPVFRHDLFLSQWQGRRVIMRRLLAPVSSEALADLQYERAMFARLTSRYVPNPLEVSEIDGDAVLVFENPGCESLRDIFNSRQLASRQLDSWYFDLDECLWLGSELARALSDIHAQGIIFNALRPENIFVNFEDKKLFLLDLRSAVARKSQRQHAGELATYRGIRYMSPEQTGRTSLKLDARSDLFSLGAVLYEALAGHSPFGDEDPHKVLYNIITKEVKFHQSDEARLPKVLRQMVLRLLDKAPAKRYQSALGLWHDLRRCQKLARESVAAKFVPVFDLGEKDVNDRFQIPELIYGRDEECSALVVELARVSVAGSSLVNIAGPSGIGKSMIVDSLQSRVFRQMALFGRGKFEQYLSNRPFSAVTDALSDLVSSLLRAHPTLLAEAKARLAAVIADVELDLALELCPSLHLLLNENLDLDSRVESKRLKGNERSQAERIYGMQEAFRQIVNALAVSCRPVTLFIDDLQWADQNSIDLIEKTFTENRLGHVLIICAYRSNEMPELHPYRECLRRIEKDFTQVRYLEVAGLSEANVAQMIQDICKVETSAKLEDFAHLVLVKTGGNPFFIHALFEFLAENDYLAYDYERQHWDWDAERIEALEVSDNVVDLLLQRLQTLPAYTRSLLSLGACIGAKFTFGFLKSLKEDEANIIVKGLWPAIEADLLAPVSGDFRMFTSPSGKDASGEILRFAHDKVQQACYELLSEVQKKHRHFDIGEKLRADLRLGEDAKKHFELANHLNQALDLCEDQRFVFELNLAAGKLAYEAGAFELACGYLEVAARVDPRGDVKTAQDWRLELLLAKGYLGTGETKKCRIVIESTTIHIVNKVMRSEFFIIKGMLEEDSNSWAKALENYFEAGRLLGFKFPRNTNLIKSFWYSIRINFLVDSGFFDWMLHSKKKTPSVKRQMIDEVFSKMATAAYASDTNWLSIVVYTYLRNSKRGNFPIQAVNILGVCGVIFVIVRSAKKAKKILKYGLRRLKLDSFSRMEATTAGFLGHFVGSLNLGFDEADRVLVDGYARVSRVEKSTNPGLVACAKLALYLIGGKKYEEVSRQYKDFSNIALKNRNASYFDWFIQMNQVVKMAGGQTDSTRSFSDELFSEDQILKSAQRSGTTFSTTFQMFKAIGMFFVGEFESVKSLIVPIHVRAELFCPGSPQLANMYTSLICSYYRVKSSKNHLEHLYIKIWTPILKWWDENSPHMCRGFYDIARAEKMLSKNKPEKAQKLLESAIEKCIATQKYFWTAYSYERLADTYQMMRMKKSARQILYLAHEAYEDFGASAVTAGFHERQFATEAEFQIFLLEYSGRNSAASPEPETAAAVDLVALDKAADTITRNFTANELAGQVLEIMLQNSGASQGSIFIRKDAKLEMTHTSHWAENSFHTSQAEGVRLVELGVPEKMAEYVGKTKETLTFASPKELADKFPSFNDSLGDFQGSTLALPVINHGQVIGVIILQNTKAEAAFGDSVVRSLKIMASQCAVSLVNANQIDDLKSQSERISRLNSQIEKVLEGTKAMATSQNAEQAIAIALTSMFQEVSIFNQCQFGLVVKEREPTLASEEYIYYHLLPDGRYDASHPDYRSEQAAQKWALYYNQTGFAASGDSTAVVGIRWRSEFIGLLIIQNLDFSQLTSEDRSFIETLNQSLSVSLRNLQYQQNLEQMVEAKTQSLSNALSVITMREKRISRIAEELKLKEQQLAEKNQILGRFLPNSLINRFEDVSNMTENLSSALEPKTVPAMMFQADLRGFTGLFQSEDSTELILLLQNYFRSFISRAQDIAQVKIVGDCIFFFIEDITSADGGSPVDQTMELLNEFLSSLEVNNRRRREQGLTALNFGMALHYGDVVVGNLSSDDCIDYTAIGPNVNFVARIEELSKHPKIAEALGENGLLLSEDAHTRLQGFLAAECCEIDIASEGVRVRSFSEITRLYYLRAREVMAHQSKAEDKKCV